MAIRAAGGFITIDTENSELWEVQSLTYSVDAISNIRLMKNLIPQGARTGIRIHTADRSSDEVMIYESFETAKKDYDDLISILADM